MDSLRFTLTRDSARPPLRGSASSAGFDLCAAEDGCIAPGARLCVATGLQVEIPAGCYGRIAPRSGLALRFGIDVGAGVVDCDYRGEVKILLFNHGDAAFLFKSGDRVAQLIIERINPCPAVEVASLSSTIRGDGGFGSSGI